MATIKVKNVSSRLYTNVGGKSIVPGETETVDASAKRDIEGNTELEIVQDVQDVQETEETEESKEVNQEKKDAWNSKKTK